MRWIKMQGLHMLVRRRKDFCMFQVFFGEEDSKPCWLKLSGNSYVSQRFGSTLVLCDKAKKVGSHRNPATM